MLQAAAGGCSLVSRDSALHPHGERMVGEATCLRRDGMRAMPTTERMPSCTLRLPSGSWLLSLEDRPHP